MYIFAFPSDQIIAAVLNGISPIGLIAVSFPATIFCAALSWHLVEGRALNHRVALGGWLESKFFTAAHNCRHLVGGFAGLRRW